MLKGHRWGGNIRELQNCIEKAVILSDGKELTAEDIQLDSRPENPLRNDAEEERLVRDAMQRSRGNISAAAKLLGVSRPTLYAKLKKYGL